MPPADARGSVDGDAGAADVSSNCRSAAAVIDDVLSIVKARVNLVVLLTIWIGFALAQSAEVAMHASGIAGDVAGTAVLLHTLFGAVLLSCGSSALNQLFEADLDRRMDRTRNRPLAAGRLSPGFVRGLGVVLVVVGTVWLVFFVQPLTAAVGATTVALYVFVYTPLKRRTAFALVVGAVPGALPPVIGWSAAVGHLWGGAAALFAIQFIWQIPHFLAIAWLYRIDYGRAQYPMLPVTDATGRSTVVQAFFWTLWLLPASLAPTLYGLGGVAYAGTAALLGLAFLAVCSWFAWERSERSARSLVFASIAYLPALFLSLKFLP